MEVSRRERVERGVNGRDLCSSCSSMNLLDVSIIENNR